jgi:hypothetical protein
MDDEKSSTLPIVTIEEATVDGHSDVETPSKRARARPLSEQLLGRSRPKAMYEDENGTSSHSCSQLIIRIVLILATQTVQ